MASSPSVGLVLGSALRPEDIGPAAGYAERAGFDEVWIAEDMFFTGGISGAHLALAATNHVEVGLGVVSAMVRHPALLAIEIATTAHAFPGRFLPGIGLGVPSWMRQIGVHPRSPRRAVRECVTVVRGLLAGESITSDADAVFVLDAVRLEHPLGETVPPIHVGVVGPRMLEMSGEVADGTLLSVCAGVDYLREAAAHIDSGRRAAGREHRITQFAICAVDDDRHSARIAAHASLAFYLLSGGPNALTDAAGITEELGEILEAGGSQAEMGARVPLEWVDQLTIAGTPADAIDRIHEYHDAGADSIALLPVPVEAAHDAIALVGDEVLPQLA